MSLDGRACLGLVDTGYSQMLVRSNLVGKLLHPKEILTVESLNAMVRFLVILLCRIEKYT